MVQRELRNHQVYCEKHLFLQYILTAARLREKQFRTWPPRHMKVHLSGLLIRNHYDANENLLSFDQSGLPHVLPKGQVAFRVPAQEYSGEQVPVPYASCALDALPSLAFRDFPLLRICRAASSDRSPDTTDTLTPAFSKTSPSWSTQLMPPPPANARLHVRVTEG